MSAEFTPAEIEQIRGKAMEAVGPDMAKLIALTGQVDLILDAYKVTQRIVTKTLIAGLEEMARLHKDTGGDHAG